MKEKMPKKRESSGLLEDEIEYCNELSEVIDADSRMEVIETLREQNNYLKELLEEKKLRIEQYESLLNVSKNKNKHDG